MGARRKLVGAVTAVVALSLMLSPAGAKPGSAPVPPRKVQVSDPAGDANFLNDASAHYNSQGILPDLGNQAGPADVSAEADILSVWFTHTAKTVTAHIQTEAAPTGQTPIAYFVATNPTNFGHWGCLLFVLRLNDPNEASPQVGYVTDSCNGVDRVLGKQSISEFTDGTGHIAITVPRSATALLGPGSVIASPVADARIGLGTPPVTDDTARGTSYKLTPIR